MACRMKLFESCRKVARNAFPKVTPNAPSELRNLPRVARKMLLSCRNVAPEAQIRPKLADAGQCLADCGRCLPDLGNILSNLLELGYILVDVR